MPIDRPSRRVPLPLPRCPSAASSRAFRPHGKSCGVDRASIGVDEAGRGALAGPVVAGAVLVTREFLEGRWAATRSGRINDSKQLAPAEREELWAEFEELAAQGKIHAHFGAAEVAEIEAHNILGATKLAMRRALGRRFIRRVGLRAAARSPTFSQQRGGHQAFQPAVSRPHRGRWVAAAGASLYPHLALVGGDARSLCIAMASIVAKVARDRMMNELDGKHPGYGFAQHKGYGTEEHRAAVLRLGALRGAPRNVPPQTPRPAHPTPGQMNFLANG